MVATIECLADLYGPTHRGGRTLVWTNGCFDLIHPGHCRLLQQAAQLGDVLLVGVNSDRSVRALKGPGRPVNWEADRAEVVAAIKWVTGVCVFDEDWPQEVIQILQPDIVVKGTGGGWVRPAELPEAEIVYGYGGKVVMVPTSSKYSSTGIIERAGGSLQ